MKQLKSNLDDLRNIFDRISVRFIAELLCSFDSSGDAKTVLDFMNEKDFDVVGVRERGEVVGYVSRVDLAAGQSISDCLARFGSQDKVLNDDEQLLKCFGPLLKQDRVFISSFGGVNGIVTKGDLEKVPTRMWIFCLLTYIEMNMFQKIAKSCPEDSWRDSISPERIKKIEETYRELKKQNSNLERVNCLQYCDKREIFLKQYEIFRRYDIFNSKKRLEEFLKDLETLRDKVAHAQEITQPNIIEFIAIVIQGEEFLLKLERG